MQEILSQGEIDSLLEALTSGKLDAEEVKQSGPVAVHTKAYDFRRPNKFSKDHLRTLEMLHQNFARLLSSFLSGYLRSSINVEVASTGQMIYEEFIRSIPSPTVIAVLQLAPLEGAVLMETNSQVVFPLIDLMFGGPGSSSDTIRELTDIEVSVVRKLYSRMLEHLSVAWQDMFQIEPNIQGIETNPRMQQLYSPNEVVALITFSVSLNDEPRGLINLCLPFIVLEPMISRLSVRQQFLRQSSGPRDEDMKWLKHWLGYSNVGLDVVLGEVDVSINDFLNLNTGDVLVLNRRLDQDLNLLIEGEMKFGVQAGRMNRKLAVQVVSLTEGGRVNG
ncbi:flagellar motor switch protein FliM [Desulfocucumis palustris]|uniref:Flagellar motor switch protein FliM n=1 Tax=Desulfocucumis palustris TaxID=1898651 RepID=A0A2L2XB51_9FIRM|nr:flagellar motor switch protein FliM [Desulfocucumis palustris]GBF33214.1 flagellar motor switch protein FliM [Desulfocucumis palustris]